MRRYEENESRDLKKLFEKLQEMASDEGKSVRIVGGGKVPKEIQDMIDEINNDAPSKKKKEELPENIMEALKSLGLVPSDEEDEDDCQECAGCADRETCKSGENIGGLLNSLLDDLIESQMSGLSEEDRITNLVRSTIITAKTSGVSANSLIASFAKHAAVMNYASEKRIKTPEDFEKKIDVNTLESKFDGNSYSGPNKMDKNMKLAVLTGDGIYGALKTTTGLSQADKLAALALAFSHILNDTELN